MKPAIAFFAVAGFVCGSVGVSVWSAVDEAGVEVVVGAFCCQCYVSCAVAAPPCRASDVAVRSGFYGISVTVAELEVHLIIWGRSERGRPVLEYGSVHACRAVI